MPEGNLITFPAMSKSPLVRHFEQMHYYKKRAGAWESISVTLKEIESLEHALL
jgi:hypothetical protein